VERAEHRNPGSDQTAEPVEWQRPLAAHEPALLHLVDEDAAVERFPVMVRLGQIQDQLAALTRSVERLERVVERLEQSGTVAAPGRARAVESTALVPAGVTARPNPMTHPLTPLNRAVVPDGSRDDVLAGVRQLFATRRRSWWQRLPNLLRG
jgi:hypothetical protein